MRKKADSLLSRRERQIMDIVYERERASAADVMEAMHDPPSYSSVRALLRVLENKGHLRHIKRVHPGISPTARKTHGLRI